MININVIDDEKSRKRPHEENEEFMPLSKSKLFDEDNDDCLYDWGFKKVTKMSSNEEKKPQIKKVEDERQFINKHDVYKADDPLKLKEEDKLIYLDSLTKIYQKNYVYVPSFHDMDGVIDNINVVIDNAVIKTISDEVESLTDILNNMWKPLYESYIKNNRLSKDCTAYKMINKGVEEYSKAKNVFEDCLKDFKSNAKNYIEVTKVWAKMDVDMLTKVFRDAVGTTLLKYRDDVNVSFDIMAKESNIEVFTRMTQENVSSVQQRVEKMTKKRKIVKIEDESDEGKGTEEVKVTEGRPISAEAMKNKGLTPYRNKANKNPRTKHRLKFKKAVVKHQNQVPRERMDEGNYQGEKNGIRKDIVKARRIK